MKNVTAEEMTAVPMTMTVQEYIPMLLMNTAFEPGTCMEFIESLTDPDVKKMAYAEYYYFSGQHEKAVEYALSLIHIQMCIRDRYHVMRYGECYVALRSQRTNHVLHCEYTSTGENLPFLEEEYEIATENGVFQMNGRWSDKSIVLQKSGNADGRKGIAQ